MEGYNVEIRGGLWMVTYTEAEGSIKFSFELGMPSEILYFPSSSVGREKAPDWAKKCRDEILSRIEADFGTNGCQVVEIESFY
jgi:hypothetical protein